MVAATLRHLTSLRLMVSHGIRTRRSLRSYQVQTSDETMGGKQTHGVFIKYSLICFLGFIHV